MSEQRSERIAALVAAAVSSGLARHAAKSRSGNYQSTLRGVMKKASIFTGIFDIKNPAAIAYARERAGWLITTIEEEARRNIRSIITIALAEGIAPAESAKLIRSLIGLGERAIAAVQRRQYDLASTGAPLDEVFDAIIAYAAQLLDQRAMMIARTETMAAANAGLAESWRQAVAAGELDPSLMKEWIPSDDACPDCLGKKGLKAPISGEFPGGDPPGHPHCRCTMGLAEADSVSQMQRAAVERMLFDPNQPRDERGRWTDGGAITAPASPSRSREEELAYQEKMAAQQHSHLAKPDVAFGGQGTPDEMRYVSAYGQEWKAAKLPKGIRRGTPKECYRNASLLVLAHPEWDYVEGYARPADLPQYSFLHAWAVDKQGNVIDPTWSHPENGQYFGVRYNRAQYLRYVRANEMYGVLGGDHFMAHLATRTGVPELRHAAAMPPEAEPFLSPRNHKVDIITLHKIDRELMMRTLFDPNEARDYHGRWTDSGSGRNPALTEADLHGTARQMQVEEYNSRYTAAEAKAQVCRDIANRMAEKNPVWANLSELSRMQEVAEYVRSWANSSGDSQAFPVAMQIAAKREFDLGDAALSHFGSKVMGEADKVLAGRANTGLNREEEIRLFLRAQYDNTQAHLADMGVTELTLLRGANYTELPAEGLGLLAMQPISSWTLDRSTAADFANTPYSAGIGYIHGIRVPAARVLGTYQSGFGCKREYEVVLLGGRALGWTYEHLGSDWVGAMFLDAHKYVKAAAAHKDLPVIPVDADLRNADWPKRTNDLVNFWKLPSGRVLSFDPNEPRDQDGKWTDGGPLSEDESKSLKDYTRTAGTYNELNASLRSGAALDEKSKSTVSALEHAIAVHGEAAPRQLYRGLSGFDPEELGLVPGFEFQDKAFVSTTRDAKTGRMFAMAGESKMSGEAVGIIFTINTGGMRGIDMNRWSNYGENEFLLPRDVFFRVTSVKPGEAGVSLTRVTMSVVKK